MYNDAERKIVYTHAYLEARPGGKHSSVVVAGIQALVNKLASITITNEHITEAIDFCNKHFNNSSVFDPTPWRAIVDKHQGKIPLNISAIPEGTIVPLGTPLVTVESTDPDCATVVTHYEGLIQKAIWYMTTVATVSLEYSSIIKKYLNLTTPKDVADAILPFLHHDFGFRGAASDEAAMLAGIAHLYISMGTDTVSAIEMINDLIFNADMPMPGYSVPASEHNVMMSKGRKGEFDVVRHILSVYKTGILSCVADTYDMRNFIEQVTTGELYTIIMARDGKFVIRPDSSFLKEDGSEMSTAETISEIFKILEKNLKDHITINALGFKVLPSQYGVIYGDGLDVAKVELILSQMMKDGWSASNIVFGTGGNLVQKGIDRDTERFAMKVSRQTYRHADGTMEIVDCAKETPGKQSKKGIFQISVLDGKIVTLPRDTRPDLENLLVTYYENGKIYKWDDIAVIRKRINDQRQAGNF